MLARVVPVGPRSVLVGAHQFLLHPLIVAWAWKRLYGMPRDPRLYLAFVLHDAGYLLGWCRNMDGPEGERHPEFGARLMRVFGQEWHDLCLYHSRFYAKAHGQPCSKLCAADKLAFGMTPRWLYLPMARLSGEIHEYMALAGSGKYAYAGVDHADQEQWWNDVAAHMTGWALTHADGRADGWTPTAGTGPSA